MNKIKVYPYKMSSKSAKILSECLTKELGYYVYRVEPKYVTKAGEVLINWGSGHLYIDNAGNIPIINHRDKVNQCIDKVEFFTKLDAGVPIPKWTTLTRLAVEWASKGLVVYCRTEIEGRDGSGIVIANTPKDVVNSKLYTVAVPSTREYRINLVNHKPIADLEKRHREGNADQQRIRTGGNGWFYVRDIVAPKVVQEAAIAASKLLDMDFVAVDVLYDRNTDTATVLEANSAPEIGPWTGPRYAKALIELIKERV